MEHDQGLVISQLKKAGFTMNIDEKTIIKPLILGDITSDYIDGLNDPEVNKFLIGPRKERQNLKTVSLFVKSNMEDNNAILFGIYIENILSGTCRLHDISNKSAFLGLALFNKRIWGKGYGSKVIQHVCLFAFEKLGLRSIMAGVETENIGSKRAFLKAGFFVNETSFTSERLIRYLN